MRNLRAKNPDIRARRRSTQTAGRDADAANVVELPGAAERKMGPVESGTKEQLDQMPITEKQKGIAAVATRLAQLIDREDHSAAAASNARLYLIAMEKLGQSRKRKSGGRQLQVVSAMAGRRRAQ